MLKDVGKKTTIILVIGIVLFSTSVLAFSIMEATSSFFADIFNPQDGFASITGFSVLAGSCTVVDAGSCAGACVATISSSTNAHVAIPGQYSNCVCCTGEDLTNTCSGTFAVFAKLLGPQNSHVAIPETVNLDYNTNLCLGVTTGTVTCHGYDDTDFQVGACDSGTCVLKLSDPENAHAEACNQANYDTYLCCEVTGGEMCPVNGQQEEGIPGEGSECTAEGLPCCDIGEEPNLDPAHCSFGIYNDLGTGHCCKGGEYWDDEFNQCRGTQPCGFGDVGSCPYDPENPEEYLFWLAEPECVNPEQGDTGVSCCPNVDWHGEPGNYLVPIHIYTGPE